MNQSRIANGAVHLIGLVALALVLLPAGLAEAMFTDVTETAGVASLQYSPADPRICLSAPSSFSCEIEWLSGGAATADVDGDDWPDLYVTRLDGPDSLFRNKGDGTFENATAAVGLADFNLQSNGAGFADVDNDGDPDLYVLTVGLGTNPVNNRFYLFINDGAGRFTEEAVERGADMGSSDDRGGYSVAFGDYDRDGWVDLYTTEWRIMNGASGVLPHSRLLRNLGAVSPGHFQDVTIAAGAQIDRNPACLSGSVSCASYGYSPAFVDLDRDGWPDLAIAADFGTSLLLWNNADGTFIDGTSSAGVGTDENGMGSTFGDYDGDGDLDWFVTSIFDPDDTCNQPGNTCTWGASGNRLFRNLGDRTFVDATDAAGVRDGYWGWGCVFLDFDNDADLDLAMTDGADFGFVAPPLDQNFARFVNDPMRFWRNDGPGHMAEMSAAAGLTDTGSGKALLTFDYDRDGDLDIFLVNNGSGGLLYRNDDATGHDWLRVKVSSGAGFNADGLGAVVTLERDQGEPIQVRQIGASSHFLSESERVAHFGLGDHPGPIRRLTVEWPGRGSAVYDAVPVNQVFVASADFIDSDGDGVIDTDERALGTDPDDPDSDADGLPDGFEIGFVSAPRDTDADGVIDALDPDDDGDGLLTTAEDANGNGNPADDDADGDGLPNYRDTESDGDGVEDMVDNCPYVVNAGQSDLNGDGIGDVCQPDDADQDGWPDTEDNCPSIVNPLQEDANNDGIGDACHAKNSVARQWNDELLDAIRRDFARPTVHARNLFHISAAMWDAWAAYDANASQVFHNERATDVDRASARAKAISFAAYRILNARFVNSPGASLSMASFDARMEQLGYDKNFTAVAGNVDPPAELGNRIAATILEFGRTDGSNEENGYANRHYQPINPPLVMSLPGNPSILDDNRWQPLALTYFVDQSGNLIPGAYPPFLSPEWGQVVPFALSAEDATIYSRGDFDYRVYHDAGPPFLLGTPSAKDYLDGFEMVALWSSQLDPSDGVLWDISPASRGNAALPEPDQWRAYYNFENGGDWGKGYVVNPVTGKPYTPQLVPRGDYARVLAEFWADGPNSETPPGHWFAIANYVTDNLAQKRVAGRGEAVEGLEWDVKLYLTLGGAMHDVAVAVWGMKGWYDYVRPVSALRAMAERGQRSEPGQRSYDSEGFELRPGFVELVTAQSSAPGERHAHLSAFVGEVAIRAWRGPDQISNPATDVAGVGWIRAREWWPYQRPSFVTPPFAGFPSGHSAFSRAAATVLAELTGSLFFPNGIGEFHAPRNEFLVFEDGPSVDVTLQYASYYDASDQTSLSRIWGGIHPPQDDLISRHLGARIAQEVVAHAQALFDGSPVDADGDGVPDESDNCPLLGNPGQEDEDMDGVGDVCDGPGGLLMSKSDNGFAWSAANSIISYEIDVGSTDAALRNVSLMETVPSRTTFHAASSTSGWVCTADEFDSTICIFEVGDLAPNSTRTLAFGVRVDDATPDFWQVFNEVRGRATIVDEVEASSISAGQSRDGIAVELRRTVTPSESCSQGGFACLGACLYCSIQEIFANPVGLQNCRHFTNPESDVSLAPSSTAAPVDVASALAPVLYRLRDRVFVQSRGGQRATDLYYQHGPAMTAAVVADGQIATLALVALRVWSPLLTALSTGDGGGSTITQEQLDSLDDFLDALRAAAGAELAAAIDRERSRVRPEDLVGSPVNDLLSRLSRLTCEGYEESLFCGEVTGDCTITSADALQALRIAVGLEKGIDEADVNGDGQIRAGDALETLRIAVGRAVQTDSCNIL